MFLVNDVRQLVYEASQSSGQYLNSLDIVGKSASAREWLLSAVQAIIDFAVGLAGSQEANTES